MFPRLSHHLEFSAPRQVRPANGGWPVPVIDPDRAEPDLRDLGSGAGAAGEPSRLESHVALATKPKIADRPAPAGV